MKFLKISSFAGTLLGHFIFEAQKVSLQRGKLMQFVQKLQAIFAKNFASEIFFASKIIFDFENFFEKNFRKIFRARENGAKSVPVKGILFAKIIFVKKLYT